MQGTTTDRSAAAVDARKRALDDALRAVERAHGKGAIMRIGDDTPRVEIGTLSTGSLAADVATGIGGVPRGRVTEVFGPESSGKTTLTLHLVASAQRAGGTAIFIDAEHALDIGYAEKLGVDTRQLLVAQPDSAEQALQIAEQMIRSGAVDIVVIDSVAALVPRAEIEGDMGDAHVGLQARLMSQALRKLAGAVRITDTALVFVNQIREKIGVMFGSPETTSGGRALKFYASMRIDIRRIAAIKDGAEVLGNRTRVKIVKNKTAPPHRQAEFDIIFGIGIDRDAELLDLGVEVGAVQKSGSWYSVDQLRLGQGREAAKAFLRENPDVAIGIEARIRDAHPVLPPIGKED